MNFCCKTEIPHEALPLTMGIVQSGQSMVNLGQHPADIVLKEMNGSCLRVTLHHKPNTGLCRDEMSLGEVDLQPSLVAQHQSCPPEPYTPNGLGLGSIN